MTSKYLDAGSPLSCFYCRQPFLGKCIQATDGHFYCSSGCAAEGQKIDMSKVVELKRCPTPAERC
jgi:hypothetical protein